MWIASFTTNFSYLCTYIFHCFCCETKTNYPPTSETQPTENYVLLFEPVGGSVVQPVHCFHSRFPLEHICLIFQLSTPQTGTRATNVDIFGSNDSFTMLHRLQLYIHMYTYKCMQARFENRIVLTPIISASQILKDTIMLFSFYMT